MCEDTSSNGQPKEVIDAVTGLVQAVPVYQDAIQPAAKEVGKGLEVVAKSVNVALSPLKAVVWGYEQFEKFISNDLSKRLRNTPEEDIVTPRLSIAGPSMEALRFAGDEKELIDMFANLLANSMDRKTESLAHPAFVEILKNMSSDEAKIMRFFATDMDSQPIIDLVSVSKTNFLDLVSVSQNKKGKQTVFNKFSIIGEKGGCIAVGNTPQYLDNLIRLGLLEVPYGLFLIEDECYQPLYKHDFVKHIEMELKKLGRKLELNEGLIRKTGFGEQFCEVCAVSRLG